LKNRSIFLSKIQYSILIFPISLMLTLLALGIYQGIWPVFLIVLLIAIYLIDMYSNTKYTIQNEILDIRCGVFYHKVIDINNIRKMSRSKIMVKMPALSMDRIKISYDRYDFVLVSPKDTTEFIRCLLQVNPNIILHNNLIEETN
jgi:hypothetical protein